MYLLAWFCAPNRPEFDDYLSRLLKFSARNACIVCATDKSASRLSYRISCTISHPHYHAILFVSVLSNPIMAIKAVQSELLCIPN